MKPVDKRVEPAAVNRRKFLLNATLGSAGAVAAVAAVAVAGGESAGVLEVAVAPPAGKSKGYHETPHILQYYQTTRI